MDIGIVEQLQKRLNEPVINIRQINTGYVNDVFLIQTVQCEYILKCFTFHDKNKIELSIALQKHLSSHGISPRIIDVWGVRSQYCVQEYVQDQQLGKNWFLFGKTLGLIHEYFKDYDDRTIKAFSFSQSYVQSNTVGYSNKVQELLLLKNRIKPLVHVPELENKQLIHGDYTWNNILKKHDSYQVVDFDEAKKYYAIYDVAKVLFNNLLTDENTWKDMHSFISGYQTVCSILPVEKKEFLNIFAYTLMMDSSGLDDKANKDVQYIDKRIAMHKKVLVLFEECDEIRRQLNW